MSASDNFIVSEAQLILDEARKQKAERTKSLGSPIQLPGKPLAVSIRGGDAWIGENTTVIRKIDLDSGKSLQLYRGHTGPVTSVAFFRDGSANGRMTLISGSWDKTIKLWDTDTKELISSTTAHSDFVKALLVLESAQLLGSGGSDKIVRFWDLSSISNGKPLECLGSISSHTRPVECLDGTITSSDSVTLYTADTMGVIKVWLLTKDSEGPQWRSSLIAELNNHRTRINEIVCGRGSLWTASTDETAQIFPEATITSPKINKPPPPIRHPAYVRCILPLAATELAEPYLITGAGDVIRVYDISSPEEPELISENDAHWHDVTALRLWFRCFAGTDGRGRVEPWIVSASLDGTIRKWRLSDLLRPSRLTAPVKEPSQDPPALQFNQFQLSEEEERELAELMDE